MWSAPSGGGSRRAGGPCGDAQLAQDGRERVVRAAVLRGEQQRPGDGGEVGAEGQALRHGDAVGDAARGDQWDARGHGERAGGGHAPVGEGGRDGAGGRVAPALDQRPVGPAGPADLHRGHAGGGEREDVLGVHAEADLLGHDGDGGERLHGRRDAVEDVAEVGVALGLDGLLDRVEVHGQRVGARELEEPHGLAGIEADAAEVGQQQRRDGPRRRRCPAGRGP